MKIPASKLILCLVLAVAVMLSFAPTASAQTCSVSSTFTAAGSGSTACFVNKNNAVRATLTGTWVGTVLWQMSRDGGVNYFTVDSLTANTTFSSPAAEQDVRFRFFISAYTSGTVTYTINDITYTSGKLKWPVIELGPVAYASLGTSTAVAATTSVYVSDVFVEAPFLATGIGVLIGAATSGTVIAQLFDSSGLLLNYTALAGTSTTGQAASTFLEIPFVSPMILPRANYYLGFQGSATTMTCRMIATNTYLGTRTKLVTGNAYGTALASFVPPTTFTAVNGCVSYVY